MWAGCKPGRADDESGFHDVSGMYPGIGVYVKISKKFVTSMRYPGCVDHIKKICIQENACNKSVYVREVTFLKTAATLLRARCEDSGRKKLTGNDDGPNGKRPSGNGDRESGATLL